MSRGAVAVREKLAPVSTDYADTISGDQKQVQALGNQMWDPVSTTWVS